MLFAIVATAYSTWILDLRVNNVLLALGVVVAAIIACRDFI
jgi:hypothetical protein